ncbi:MAG TPA: hypothetical protein VGO96_11915 [Pyrinomonadaceae bacterium]|jgi:hypothetical protein|nr:hypothetical protein [Pyrinomonadaceae bacterium]
MDVEVKLYFRDQLREARAVALRDAEGFGEIIFVLERLGSLLSDKIGLGKKADSIIKQANESSLAEKIPNEWRGLHTPFPTLYKLVQDARNTAMHEGAFARHLTTHAIELSIILEHALMKDIAQVCDFMVRNPVSASLWQPLSFIRQSMLINSFSYLPVLVGNVEPVWKLISDLEVARYLRSEDQSMRERLALSIEKAIVQPSGINLQSPKVCDPEFPVAKLFAEWDGLPILIKTKSSNDLLGIVTAFDLL